MSSAALARRFHCPHARRTCKSRAVLAAVGSLNPKRTTLRLIIGDSVSNGYFLEGTLGSNVPDLLSDVALTQHAPFSPGSGGAGPTSHGLACLEVYLQLATGAPAKYDAITFNFVRAKTASLCLALPFHWLYSAGPSVLTLWPQSLLAGAARLGEYELGSCDVHGAAQRNRRPAAEDQGQAATLRFR